MEDAKGGQRDEVAREVLARLERGLRELDEVRSTIADSTKMDNEHAQRALETASRSHNDLLQQTESLEARLQSLDARVSSLDDGALELLAVHGDLIARALYPEQDVDAQSYEQHASMKKDLSPSSRKRDGTVGPAGRDPSKG